MNASPWKRYRALSWAVLLSAAPGAFAGSFTFTGAVSSDWSNAQNWNPSGIPGAGDTATINTAKTVNVTADTTVQNLTLNHTQAVLGGTAKLTVTGDFTWNAGTRTGPGVTEIPAGATLNVTGTNTKPLSGAHTLNNAGSVVWSGSGGIIPPVGSSVVINNSGTFDIKGTTTLGFSGGLLGTFNNSGTFKKSAGSGGATVTANFVFNNTGTVSVEAGRLTLAPGGTDTHTGAFTVAAGATLAIQNGTHTLSDTASISGAGNVEFSGAAVVEMGGSYTVTGKTTLNSGEVAFNKDATLSNLDVISSSVLRGSATLTVTGVCNWNQGVMQGSGTTAIAPGATLNLAGATGRSLGETRTLNNAGAVNWTGGNLTAAAGASATVNNSGTFDVKADVQLGAAAAASVTFNNSGAFKKSAGTVATGMQILPSVTFNNSGSVEVSSGLLRFLSAGTDTFAGTTTVTGAASVLRFGNGTFNFTPESTLTGAGEVRVDSGTVNENGAYTLSGKTTLDGGTLAFNHSASLGALEIDLNGALAGSGETTVTGTLDWKQGGMAGGGSTVVAPGAVLNMLAGDKTLGESRSLVNNGTVNWVAGNLFFAPGASNTLTNAAAGLFDLQADGLQLGASVAQAAVFNNAGTFRKSGGTGAGGSVVGQSVTFNNAGAVEVKSGVLKIEAGGTGTDTGTFSVDAGATLDFDQTSENLNAGAAFAGAGDVIVENSTLTLNADVGLARLAFLSGSIAGPGTLTVTGAFDWRGGTMEGAGQTALPQNATLILTGDAAKTLGGSRVLNLAGTTDWLAGDIAVTDNATPVVNNTGLFDAKIDRVLGVGNNAQTAVFNNPGTFRKSAGSGITKIFTSVNFNNSGTVEVLTGTLSLTSGGVSADTGAFHVTAGARLQFAGGEHNLAPGSAIDGAGSVDFNGGKVTLAGTYTPTGPTTLSLGTLAVNSDVTIPDLDLSGGALGGSGNVTLTGAPKWTGGTMEGSGTTTVKEGVTLDAATEGVITLADSRKLDNAGTFNLAGLLAVNTPSTAAILNSGLFDLRSDGFVGGSGPPTATFTNTGTLRRTNTTGTATIGGTVNLTNAGLIEVQSGKLALTNGLTQTAGELKLNGGGVTATSGVVNVQGGALTGYGTIQGNVTTNGTIRPNGPNGPIGELAITGDLSMTENSVLEIDVKSPTEFDVVNANTAGGNTSTHLDGKLQINFVEGFDPSPDESAEVVRYNTHTGEFNLKTTPDQRCLLNIIFDANSAKLSLDAIPGGVVVPTGDVNGDTSLDVSDVVLLLRFIVGSIDLNLTQLSVADLKQDCTVNVSDAVAILRKIVGLPNE